MVIRDNCQLTLETSCASIRDQLVISYYYLLPINGDTGIVYAVLNGDSYQLFIIVQRVH